MAKQGQTAARSGADVAVAPGWEADEHVGGTVATMALVPAGVYTVSPVPVVAAGGIADGRGLASALALGASGVWIGTQFLASPEASTHENYRARLLETCESYIEYLDNLFDIGSPDAPHRVLHNKAVTDWEQVGRPHREINPVKGR